MGKDPIWAETERRVGDYKVISNGGGLFVNEL